VFDSHIVDLEQLVTTAHVEASSLSDHTNASKTPLPSCPDSAKKTITIKPAVVTADTASAFASASNTLPPSTTSGPSPTEIASYESKATLIQSVKALQTLLTILEMTRKEWWVSKAAQRRQWDEARQVTKLTKLYVLNNGTAERISGMKGKLGTFCRWNLGVAIESLCEED